MRKIQLNGMATSIACQKDKIYIDQLERELKNCYQEIDYLQDQLNQRSLESSFMGEHIQSLEPKLTELEKMNERLTLLGHELAQADSDRLVLMGELKYKEEELEKSVLQVQKLEAALLDSQCETESLKLELNDIEERLFESRDKQIRQLSEGDCRRFFSIVGEQLDKVLERIAVHMGGKLDQDLLLEARKDFPLPDNICDESVGPLLSKLAVVTEYDEIMKNEIERMTSQIEESGNLVKQLKDELQEEKRKAKEDAEDLTQEMAELRYQITGMLEEEYKRRAFIEEASIKRITELEDRVMKEQNKAIGALKRYHEAHELAERKTIEIKKLKKALERFELSRCLVHLINAMNPITTCCISQETLRGSTQMKTRGELRG